MSESFPVLISSAGRRVALMNTFRAAQASLGLTGGVLAADMGRLSSAFHSADRAFIVPRCTVDEFIPTMLELCERQGVRLLVPTIDTELPFYAAARERFEQIGTTIVISTPEVIRIAGDKIRTHEWLVSAGLPTVRQASVEQVRADPGAWPWPLLVKPVGGSSSIGVAVVGDLDELMIATRGEEYIVQTLAPGAEFTISFLASRDGRCLCAVPRQRLETRAGEVSKGRAVRSASLEALAARVCHALPGAYGALNVQVFEDPDSGELNIIEINPRFGGGFPLAHAAGADYPKWIIEELLGRTSTASGDGWQDGLVMLRYDDAVFVSSREAGL